MAFLLAIIIMTKNIMPKPIPSLMELVRMLKKMVNIVAKTAGLLSKSRRFRLSLKIAVPIPKMANEVTLLAVKIENTGKINALRSKSNPAVTDIKPVLAPTPIPALLSKKVVVELVPKGAAMTPLIASAKNTFRSLMGFPSLSNNPACVANGRIAVFTSKN